MGRARLLSRLQGQDPGNSKALGRIQVMVEFSLPRPSTKFHFLAGSWPRGVLSFQKVPPHTPAAAGQALLALQISPTSQT